MSLDGGNLSRSRESRKTLTLPSVAYTQRRLHVNP